MIGVSFISAHALALAIDRTQFRYHVIVDETRAEISTLQKWLDHADERKQVVVLNKVSLLHNGTIRDMIAEVGSVIVYGDPDVLADMGIEAIDALLDPSGRWDIRLDMNALNGAISTDSVDFTKVQSLPTSLRVDNDLPRVMTYRNTVTALEKNVRPDHLDEHVPILAGFLAGIIKRKTFDRTCRVLVEHGARPDVLEEFRYYCVNEGRATRSVYKAIQRSDSIEKSVDYFCGEERDPRDVEREARTLQTVIAEQCEKDKSVFDALPGQRKKKRPKSTPKPEKRPFSRETERRIFYLKAQIKRIKRPR